MSRGDLPELDLLSAAGRVLDQGEAIIDPAQCALMLFVTLDGDRRSGKRLGADSRSRCPAREGRVVSRGRVRVDVECDGCRRVESFIAEAKDTAAAAAAAAAGWLSNPARDLDLCPDCFVERVGSRVSRVLL